MNWKNKQLESQTVNGKILRLRLFGNDDAKVSGVEKGKRVTWAPGTIDNSKLKRWKSKVCCIFHKTDQDTPSNKNKYERGPQ